MNGVKKLRRVRGIDGRTLEVLAGCQLFTAKDLLSCSVFELVQLLDMREDDVETLVSLVSSEVCPKRATALSMVTTFDDDGIQPTHAMSASARVVATSLRALDELLHGGVRAGSVTEVVGPPGIGKTQFCHMLSVIVASQTSLRSSANGNDIARNDGSRGYEVSCGDDECVSRQHGVIYFNTEASFSAERLLHMTCCRYPGLQDNREALQIIADSVIVVNVTTSEEFLEKLDSLENVMIDRSVGLLIVDSIAALPRREYDSSAIWQRQAMLGKAAAHLKSLAETFDIPVVVTNQVTHSGSTDVSFDFDHDPFCGSIRQTTAALGTAWAHCVNTRLVFERTDEGRMITIAKSPYCAVWSVPYLVDDSGIVDEVRFPPKQWTTNFWDSAIQNHVTAGDSGAIGQQHKAVQAQQSKIASLVSNAYR